MIYLRTTLICSLMACCNLCFLTSEAAARYHHRRGGSNNNAARVQAVRMQAQYNVAVAGAVLVEANRAGSAAQGKINNAQTIASAAADNGRRAKSEILTEGEELHAIEDRIANDQSPDSEFSKALTALEVARDHLRDVRKSITSSSAYKQREDAALNGLSAERAHALQILHDEMLQGNTKYLTALADYESTHATFTNLQQKLNMADKEWQAKVKEIREARVVSNESKAKLTGAGLSKMSSRQDLKKAAVVANQAAAVVAANQAVLNSLPGARRQPSPAVASKAAGKK